MKRISILFIAFFCSVNLFSCISDVQTNMLNSEEPLYWEQVLNSIINSRTRAEGSVALVGYIFEQTISSQKDKSAIVNEMLAGDSYMVISESLKEPYKQYKIMTVSESIKLFGRNIFTGRKELILEPLSKVKEIGVVQLIWNYEGKEIRTKLLVDMQNNMPLYDNIASYIPMNYDVATESKLSSEEPVSVVSTTVKSREEIVTKNIHKQGSAIALGQIPWAVDFSFKSIFRDGILYDREHLATSSARPGWSCAAEARAHDDVHIGVSTYDEVLYAYSYSENTNVSIGWNSSYFEFSGGGVSSTGSCVLRP